MRVASEVNEPVMFVSRNGVDDSLNRDALTEAFGTLMKHYSTLILCDGGGDSLILQPGDACANSETTDPFEVSLNLLFDYFCFIIFYYFVF